MPGYCGDGLDQGSGCALCESCTEEQATTCDPQLASCQPCVPYGDVDCEQEGYKCACDEGYCGDGLDQGSGCAPCPGADCRLVQNCHDMASCEPGPVDPGPTPDDPVWQCSCPAGYCGDGLDQ
eukprot:3932180-Rhodomonas_salina.1